MLNVCFSSLSLHRSSGFQDRQRSSLFRRHFHQRSRFKEGMMKYEVERSQSLRREKKGRDKLDELERREAFLQGKKDHLLAEIRAPFEALFASPPSIESFFNSPPRKAKTRKTEAGSVSVFQSNSGFLDSGNFVSFSLIFSRNITLARYLYFLNQIDNLVTAESVVAFISYKISAPTN